MADELCPTCGAYWLCDCKTLALYKRAPKSWGLTMDADGLGGEVVTPAFLPELWGQASLAYLNKLAESLPAWFLPDIPPST